ncbi:MAG TPA: CBS domain-containing protein [Anaerolineales bacterium]
MITVKQLIQAKGNAVWSITPDSTVYEALKLLAEKEVGALLVLENERLAGIISERDYARKVILKGKNSMDTPVREIMTSKVVTVRPDQTIDDCMALMTENRIRHLPVVEGDRLVGVISIGDVVKAIISQQEFVIEQLENYIIGRQ